jgi:hypothetical protein
MREPTPIQYYAGQTPVDGPEPGDNWVNVYFGNALIGRMRPRHALELSKGRTLKDCPKCLKWGLPEGDTRGTCFTCSDEYARLCSEEEDAPKAGKGR